MQTDRETDRKAGKQTHIRARREADRQRTYRQVKERQANRQTYRQADSIDRQTVRHVSKSIKSID